MTGVTHRRRAFEDGTASGMAPGAKVAAYKVCWTGKPGVADGCFNSDSVAAINDAVARRRRRHQLLDRRHAPSPTSLDPVAQAFRGASNAGVFVANSAGNSGPGASTLDHPSPWVTTVAAATHPPRLPGRRARQRRPLRRRLDHAVADDADAARHLGERQARRARPTPTPRSARRARSTRRRRPARSCCATAASSTASTRASRSSGPAASAW